VRARQDRNSDCPPALQHVQVAGVR
jgi:hypothetical protein